MTPPAQAAAPAAAPSLLGRPLPTRPIREEAFYSLPYLMVLGYLLVDFGRPQSWVPPLGVIRPGLLVQGGAILCLLAWREMYLPRVAQYAMAFWVFMVLHIPFAYNPRVAFNWTRDWSVLFFGAMVPLMTFVNSYERLRTLLTFWVWLHVPLALYSLKARGTGGGGAGIGSFLGDENDLALALNVVLPYGFALAFLIPKLTRKLMMLAVCGLLVIAVTVTLSRGGFIGLVVLGIAIWLKSPRKMASLAGVVVLAVMMLIVTPQSYWDEMKTIQTSTNEDDTGHARMYLWGIAWQMFLDNPVFGVGAGNYQYNNVNYETEYERSRGRHIWGLVSHSLYFTVLPEHGLVGSVIFIAIIGSLWMTRRRARRRLKVALADKDISPQKAERAQLLLQVLAAMDTSQITFLVTGAFISVLYYPHLWLLLALTAAGTRIVDIEFPPIAPTRPAAQPRMAARPLLTPLRKAGA